MVQVCILVPPGMSCGTLARVLTSLCLRSPIYHVLPTVVVKIKSASTLGAVRRAPAVDRVLSGGWDHGFCCRSVWIQVWTRAFVKHYHD